MALKVHLSDASTHQPLSDATVEVFANYTPVARETSGSDGNIFIRFPYRLGDLLVITATKRGYVPNSAPWRPARLPGTIWNSLGLNVFFLVPSFTPISLVRLAALSLFSNRREGLWTTWVNSLERIRKKGNEGEGGDGGAWLQGNLINFKSC